MFFFTRYPQHSQPGISQPIMFFPFVKTAGYHLRMHDDPRIPLRRRLRVRHLELLAMLEREPSLHRAAAALAMTQPAASKLLSEAESAVGLQLFERTRQGVVATSSGLALVARAKLLLTLLDEARDELLAIEAGAAGLVRVGAFATVAPVLIPAAIKWLRQRKIPLRIRLEEAGAPALFADLKEGLLDCVVGRVLEGHDTSGLFVQPLFHEPVVVIARSQHPVLRLQQIDWAAASRYEWVLPPPSTPVRQILHSWFTRNGWSEPACVFESISVIANVSVVRESNALAVLPGDIAEHYAELGLVAIVPLQLDGALPTVSLIKRANQPEDVALSIFVQALTKIKPPVPRSRKGPDLSNAI
ncbi:MAG: LysR family transcriptional regulator [Delftia acidovorans]|nr:LysR family transcriptional regulator [Delftia acidovorans]